MSPDKLYGMQTFFDAEKVHINLNSVTSLFIGVMLTQNGLILSTLLSNNIDLFSALKMVAQLLILF